MIWSGNDDSDLVDVAKVSKQFSMVKISKVILTLRIENAQLKKGQ